MRAKELSDLLKKGDRVAVSNITGREASKVTEQSQKYCNCIVGGWALGKGGTKVEAIHGSIPVYSTFEELIRESSQENLPNKIIIYSPPEAVYGEVKEIVEHGKDIVETIFIITEHVSVEATAKIYKLCKEQNIDVIGCNTLGIINVHDHIRIGAVGGDSPEESFVSGSVTVISNSGNMVNTITSYLKAAGMGTAFGVSTGKDTLILTPLKELLLMAERDINTKVIVLYVEPGGVYESQALSLMEEVQFTKPIIVYVAGKIAEKYSVALGHAGAVVEGKHTSASGKMEEFDKYFGTEAFEPDSEYIKTEEIKESLLRGIRVKSLHDIPRAVGLIVDMLDIGRDYATSYSLSLNPWFVNLRSLENKMPKELSLTPGIVPEPYLGQFKELMQKKFTTEENRQNMRNASHASSNDGVTPRVYGYSLTDMMKNRSLAAGLILYWTGELPRNEFEERLAEMTIMASLTNGPGTISAQGAKLSASAGNSPNTAMISTLATTGSIHGGNGSRAAKFLLEVFEEYDFEDPYAAKVDVRTLAAKVAEEFKKNKAAAKEAAREYEKIPCLGHPVFKDDAINFDPREQIIYKFIKDKGYNNIFLEFYHELVVALKEKGVMKKVLAVNVDAALACVWLSICWSQLRAKKMTLGRAMDIPFVAFALGRAAGGAGEYLDHQDYGTEMDMRIPVSECKTLTKQRDFD